MTIKPKSPYRALDDGRIASFLTPGLLERFHDEAPYGTAAGNAGEAWLGWGHTWHADSEKSAANPSLD